VLDTYQKILIIQTAFIGDVILTTPLVAALAEHFPNADLDFLTIPKSKNLLESDERINDLIIFDKRDKDRGFKGLVRIGELLQKNQYDLCITPHRSLRSAYLSWKTKAGTRIGFNRSAFTRAFSHVVTYNPSDHEIERNLSLLSAIGLKRQISKPVLTYTEEDQDIVDKFLQDHNAISKKIFAVAPGSIWPTKKWPEKYFGDFCALISNKDYQIVLIGGPEDQTLCQKICNKQGKYINSAGEFSLRQTYYLLRQCRGILTNDSAPLHLGMAADISVFAIFGPTVPEFGFAPFGEKSKVFEDKDLNCRPCAIHGGKKCPIKTFDCMESLIPGSIAEEVLGKLS
jgi:heptosyltransferase-2